jgi:hypothetical protein
MHKAVQKNLAIRPVGSNGKIREKIERSRRQPNAVSFGVFSIPVILASALALK